MALRVLVFLSAFLLFASEPLVARMVLPAAGGGAHVWTAALMFFQGALLVGYLYCHWVAPRIGRWHLLVACLPLAFLPLGVTVDFDATSPVASVIVALTSGVAIPFVVLATTAVLAQSWLAASDSPGAGNPYSLYAASNAGSLTALLLYPLAIAPMLSLRVQAWAWSAGYVAYAALLWKCAPRAAASAVPDAEAQQEQEQERKQVSWRQVVPWLVLAAAPSALLLAVTNVIEQDVGSAPLVWVVPLAVYLLSFVLVFRERPLYPPFVRRFWLEISAVGLFLFSLSGSELRWWVGLFHLVTLLAVCVVAHANLYELRPAPRRLTTFYITLAVGGWAGAAFVAVLAPRLFDSIAEYPLALAAVPATLAVARRRRLSAFLRAESRTLLVASAAFLVFLGIEAARASPAEIGRPDTALSGTLHKRRNAYGILRVTWTGEENNRMLTHGTTMHGWQNLSPDQRRRPFGYYARESPLGDVLRIATRPRRAAVIGLGAGTMAAYFERGESVTFYELDPDVVDIARTYFTYLADSQAAISVVVGDGRVQLSKPTVPDEAYSVLIVDAFSSDAIPTHLLTREAVELFLRKIENRGYLLFHISNRHHDLRPVLRTVGDTVDAFGAYKTRLPPLPPWEVESTYFVLTRDPRLLERLIRMGWTRADDSDLPHWRLWTDDYVNLLPTITWDG